MKGWLAGLLLVAATAPAAAPAPGWAERLLYSSRERTRAGIAAYEKGDGAAAMDALDAAARLAPDSPLARFNRGTAHLAAKAPDAAALLDLAARGADPAVAPAAWYNLGNARWASGDPRAAIAAYRETLRREPTHGDAKFNLELALKALEEQQKQQEQQEPQQKQQNQRQDAKNGQQDQQQSASDRSQQPNDRREGEEPPPEDSRAEREQQPTPQNAGDPLQQFREQPQMSREQARAILEAVDNLEREQRRKAAAERARDRRRVEIDW